MKINEVISTIDAMKPNNYTQSEKIKWLSTLDWTVKLEIIDTHEDGDDITYDGYTEDTDLETDLLIPAPYDEVYLRWLEARIDYANGEYGKYNNSVTMYNSAYNSYANYYNRKHMPIGSKLKYF